MTDYTKDHELIVNLRVLLQTAQQDFPVIAGQYERATAAVAETANGDISAFTGRISPVWQVFRNEFQRLLAQSQGNIQDTSVALIHTVNAYVTEDGDAADALRDQIKEWNQDNPKLPYPEADGFTPPKFEEPDIPSDQIDEPVDAFDGYKPVADGEQKGNK